MTKPGAVVDVVGAEAGPHQFLEQIGFFVRALRRAEAGQRLDALLVANSLQAVGGDVERLFPRRFAEMRERIGRIDLVVGVLFDARQTHQRFCQPVGMMDVVEAEAALDAETVVICRAVAALGIDDLVVLDLIRHLAADAADRDTANRLSGRDR